LAALADLDYSADVDATTEMAGDIVEVASKGMSAKQLYHKHVIHREQAKGFKGKVCTREFWAMVTKEWEDLAPGNVERKVLWVTIIITISFDWISHDCGYVFDSFRAFKP